MENTTINSTAPNKGFNWADYFSFRNMIALQIIQLVYILCAIGVTIYGLMLLFNGGSYFGEYVRIEGFLILTLGNILLRVWCELIIVIFRINKTLNNIEENTKG